MTQQDGELRFEVGGKRKREADVYSGNKRVRLGRILDPRSAASQLIASPPTLAPTSISSNAPASLPHPIPPPAAPPIPSPPPLLAGQPLPVHSHRGLVEAIKLYNDIPTLRAEIEWMRAQRKLRTSQKETHVKKPLIDKTSTATPTSNWNIRT